MIGWKLALTAAVLLASATLSAADEICVKNQDKATLLFVAEAFGGERVVAHLSTGEVLCAKSTEKQGGVVSVFESANDLEGCSRLVPASSGTRVLHRYVSFDRCGWDNNTE